MPADTLVIASQGTDAAAQAAAAAAQKAADEAALKNTTVDGDGKKVTVHRTEGDGTQGGEKLILGKFKTAADLEAAYVELEKKQSGAPAPKPDAKPATPPIQSDLAATAAQAGFKVEELAAEYRANGGKLTDATQAKLTEKGITAPMIETYVNGIKQQATADRAELLTVLNGNEADLETLYDWAGKNLPKEVLEGYNALVSGATRNIPAAKLMLDSFVSRYNEALGRDPSGTVTAEAGSRGAGPQPFGDRSEMIAAMSDKRYETSEAYRRSVEARVAVTQF